MDGSAHDRRDSITLEIVHEQIGGGGQIRDGPHPVGRDAVLHPLGQCLAAHAEEARRLGLAQTPYLHRAREGSARAPTIEAFGKGVKPCAFVRVRGVYLLGCFVRRKLVDCRDAVHDSVFDLTQPCVNRNQMSISDCGRNSSPGPAGRSATASEVGMGRHLNPSFDCSENWPRR